MQMIDIKLYGVIAVCIIVLFFLIRYLIRTTKRQKKIINSYTNYDGNISTNNINEYFYVKEFKETLIDKSKQKIYKKILKKRLKLTSISGLGSYGNFFNCDGPYGTTYIDFYKIHLNDVIPEKQYLYKLRIKKLKKLCY